MFILIGVDGKEYGPAPASLIREWIAAGRASLALTQARREGETALQPLGSFPEFAAEVTPAAAIDPALPPVQTATAFLPDAVTPPAGAIDASLASRGARFLAKLIDTVIFGLIFVPSLIALFGFGGLDHFSGFDAPRFVSQFTLLGGLLLTLSIVQLTLLTLRGQTIGKILLHIRIVRYADAAPADFVHVVLLRAVLIYIFGLIPVLGLPFSLVNICFIFGVQKRCLHDLLAGTKVVTVRPPSA